ncbi:hypothetical protein [Sulfurovum sp.]|uniref:hypothetical protein n=1 Tax=Sulfurovum sp. TaxID=1969726 RepID=UPI0025DAD78D|nr:hypothetical protein [Sulfurovum sp.]
MLINNAIKKAQAQEAEKVAISLKVSVEIKEKLQKLADQNNVSLNALCSSILESALNGELDELGTMQLLEELSKAKDSLDSIKEAIHKGVDTVEATNGVTYDMHFEEEILYAKVKAITAELQRRGAK